MSDDQAAIATVPKNAREEIRIDLTEYRGHDLIDCRTYANNGVDFIPTKKGITLSISHLPALIKGLRLAESEARECGLLDAGDDRDQS